MKKMLVFLMVMLLCVTIHSNAEEDFDVRQHLATVSRYGAVKNIADNSFVPSKIPEQCYPIHLNLVARHGTRAPTKKKMKSLEALSAQLENLLEDSKGRKMSLEKIPSWFKGWKSPWKGKVKGGELIRLGEEELYELGIRIRAKFPQIFDQDYHPDIYQIKATQIPRASASAVAFGMGMFSEKGNLGPGRHQAFAVSSENRASDILLRFHDCCQNYKAFRKSQEPGVDKLKKPVLDEITNSLVNRYGLKFTRQEVSSLWFLCKQEASLLNKTDQACALFTPSEVELLEWTDDLELFILKGYGSSLNYRMGVPLLQDVIHSMEQAILAKRENRSPGDYEKARMRFAHAETLLPFSCLIGLFLEGSELEQLQKEKPLELPAKPPQKRKWRGSTVAPFGGNNILVLYSCSSSNNSAPNFFVQVLHNEHPIPMPGCSNSDFCPFDVFKDKIAGPHLKHSYNAMCDAGKPKEKSFSSKILSWLFSDYTQSDKSEL
jgi:multiple inositol-polyphosphate phosphatase/2,3-bisphosphoglycerate 3-phosphatase